LKTRFDIAWLDTLQPPIARAEAAGDVERSLIVRAIKVAYFAGELINLLVQAIDLNFDVPSVVSTLPSRSSIRSNLLSWCSSLFQIRSMSMAIRSSVASMRSKRASMAPYRRR
jgi:hypothetical protein